MQKYKPIIIEPTFSFKFLRSTAKPFHRSDDKEGSRSIAERFVVVIRTKPSPAHVQRSLVTFPVANIVTVIQTTMTSTKKIQYTCAVLLILTSIMMVAFQVFTIQDVANGLLIYIGQAFLLAGSIFGLDYYIDKVKQTIAGASQ